MNLYNGIVSGGSTYALQEDIQPEISVRFDLRVQRAPCQTPHLYDRAERDWQ